MQKHMEELLEAAFAGDVRAAVERYRLTPTSERVTLLWVLADGHPGAFRAALRYAWGEDKTLLTKEFREKLPRVFMRAGFDLADLPETVTVWNGGVSFGAREHSLLVELAFQPIWTLRREIAAFWATGRGTSQLALSSGTDAWPAVICAEVPRFYIAADLGGVEHEVVLLLSPQCGKVYVDGEGPLDCIGDGWRPSDALVSEWRSIGAQFSRSARSDLSREP